MRLIRLAPRPARSMHRVSEVLDGGVAGTGIGPCGLQLRDLLRIVRSRLPPAQTRMDDGQRRPSVARYGWFLSCLRLRRSIHPDAHTS